MKIKTYTAILILVSLTSCFSLFDGGSDTIIGDYSIGWIDVHESRSIHKQEGLVPAYVFAVGHNSEYIIAKQHPYSFESRQKVNKSITNYFIIKVTKDQFQDKSKGVYGPLTRQSFDSLSHKFNLSSVKFDMTYPEIP